ncbi:MAG: pyridoxine 5'-phosphate synthase [Candidatus Zixiibacteriota bacterium]|nr:MAG: pyridoxine 5'-phosphate synthase [candidate division Zixibacteria bacterium]
MSALTVNIDLVALMRSVRRMAEPDPAQAAVLSELAGADGISVRVRRDRRYIRDRDLYVLKNVVKTKLIVELPLADELIEQALEIKPWMVLFVADHADSDSPVTTIDFAAAPVGFNEVCDRFKGVGVNTGFFIEPEADDVRGAARAGASAVLFNCSGYTQARTLEEARGELDRIERASGMASKHDLAVYCGRGIGYKNIQPLAEMGFIDEFVVGYAIGARAMLVGYQQAVREMLSTLKNVKNAR